MHSYEFLQVTERDIHTNIYEYSTSSGDKVQLMNTLTHTLIPCLGGLVGQVCACLIIQIQIHINKYNIISIF